MRRHAMLAAMAFAASAMAMPARNYSLTDEVEDLTDGTRLDPKGDGFLSLVNAPVPRPRHTAGGSRYTPHQGNREMERRRKQLAKRATHTTEEGE